MSGRGMRSLRHILGSLLASAGAACGEVAPARPSFPVVPGSAPPLVRFQPELREAVRAFDARQYELGRERLRAHLARHEDDAQARMLFGMSHYWTGNYGAARPWLVEALARQPDLHVAREALAFSLLLLGEVAAAGREYELYSATIPGDPKGHYGLGLVALEETRLEAAAGHFRRALELFQGLDPRARSARQAEFAECHARLGETCFQRGELAEARAELLQATTLAPGNISAFYTLSLVHRRLGEEALADAAAARYEAARQALLAGQRNP